MSAKDAVTIVQEIFETLRNLTQNRVKDFEGKLFEWEQLIKEKFCKVEIATVFDLFSIQKSVGGPDSPFDIGFTQWSSQAYSPSDWLENNILLHAGMYIFAVQYYEDSVWPDYIDVMEGEGVQPPILEIILMHDNKALVQVCRTMSLEKLEIPDFLEDFSGTWGEVILKAHEYQKRLLALHEEVPHIPLSVEELERLSD